MTCFVYRRCPSALCLCSTIRNKAIRWTMTVNYLVKKSVPRTVWNLLSIATDVTVDTDVHTTILDKVISCSECEKVTRVAAGEVICRQALPTKALVVSWIKLVDEESPRPFLLHICENRRTAMWPRRTIFINAKNSPVGASIYDGRQLSSSLSMATYPPQLMSLSILVAHVRQIHAAFEQMRTNKHRTS